MKYRRQRVDLRSFLQAEVPRHELPAALREQVRRALAGDEALRPVVGRVVQHLLQANLLRKAGVLRDGAARIPVYSLAGSTRVYDLRELRDGSPVAESSAATTTVAAPAGSRPSLEALRRTLRRDWVSHGLEASLETVLHEMGEQLEDPSLRLWICSERLGLSLGSGSPWDLLDEDDERLATLDARFGPGNGLELRAEGRTWLPLRVEGRLVGALGTRQGGDRVARTGALDTLEELLQAFQRSQQRVFRDPLTGLHNRAFFDQQFAVELARAKRIEQPLALLYADLDHFKRINDRYGHDAGDAVLRHVARLMVGHLRRIDYVFRWGGEEFALLLPGTASEEALYTADRLRAVVEESPVVLPSGEVVKITLSIGLAMAPEHATGGEREMLRLADEALYRAKSEGRNRVCRAKLPG